MKQKNYDKYLKYKSRELFFSLEKRKLFLLKNQAKLNSKYVSILK